MTCDDFLAAMADANGEDLSGIGRWYSQAGTPQLTVSTSYDASARTFTITTKQVGTHTAGVWGCDGQDPAGLPFPRLPSTMSWECTPVWCRLM